MCEPDSQQEVWGGYKTLEERPPEDQPLRIVRVLTNTLLKSMDCEFEKLYSRPGRPPIPREIVTGLGKDTPNVLEKSPEAMHPKFNNNGIL